MTRLPPVRVVRAATGVRTAIQGLPGAWCRRRSGRSSRARPSMAARRRTPSRGSASPTPCLPGRARRGRRCRPRDGRGRDLPAPARQRDVRHRPPRRRPLRPDGRRSRPLRRTWLDEVRGADDRRPALPGGVGPAARGGATGGPRAEAVHGVSMWEAPLRPSRLRARLQRRDGPAGAARLADGRGGLRRHPSARSSTSAAARLLLALMLGAAPAADGVLLEQPAWSDRPRSTSATPACWTVAACRRLVLRDCARRRRPLRPAAGRPRLRRRHSSRAAHQPPPAHAARSDAPADGERRTGRRRTALRQVARPRHAALRRWS